MGDLGAMPKPQGPRRQQQALPETEPQDQFQTGADLLPDRPQLSVEYVRGLPKPPGHTGGWEILPKREVTPPNSEAQYVNQVRWTAAWRNVWLRINYCVP